MRHERLDPSAGPELVGATRLCRTDPETGQRRQLSRTVQGVELRHSASCAPLWPLPMSEPLSERAQRWASSWSGGSRPTSPTGRQPRCATRSIIDRHRKPRLGQVLVRELTTVMIDDFYASLRIEGGVGGGSLSRGSVQRVHGVLHRALAQAMRWEWI
jgi:hypothetical protein